MEIRNFSIIAHVDHGKSTLADRFLELTKTVPKEKMQPQYLDRMPLERERGITIKLQPVTMAYQTQINADRDADKRRLLYEDLTYTIRGHIFKVYNGLGPGHKESVYREALENEFNKSNLIFEKEKSINIFYEDKKVGIYRPDFIIDNKIILEIKVLPFISQKEKKQIWTYLKGSEYKLALMVNFGSTNLEIKRIIYDVARYPRESALSPRESAYMLNLVDTPGHIDFYYEVTRTLAAVEGVILLVDASQGVQAQTISHLEAAKKQNLVIIPVINKIDIPGINLDQVKKEITSLLKIKEDEILLASAKSGLGIEEILEQAIKKIPPPKGSKEKHLKALVFDSLYDEFRGVIFCLRIFDGQVKAGDFLKMINSGKNAKVLEVGVFKPERRPTKELSAGQIGYIVTDLKEISQCKVGETITSFKIKNQKFPISSRILDADFIGIGTKIKNEEEIKPLSGYQEPLPMVFAGFYPTRGEDWQKLRLALNKLKLNDASFTFDLEQSPSLGYGARIGALGSLHLEIIKERLVSEYNLDLIISSPSVRYLVKTKDDREVYIQNPEKFPSREKISSILEPWLKVEIVSPVRFSSLIFQLVKNFRGKIILQRYLLQEEEFSKVIIQVEMPLALIIIDFYDKLKSVSSGYATLFWQFLEYRPAILVKLDILIAGEKFPSLAKLVYQDEVLKKASQMVGRLKEIMPRQLFEVKIQAAVSGKIISSAALPALRKDVTKKLYGGDITRKMKLLAKQREGKKKLLRLSKIDLPKEIYWKIVSE